jgi:hypothetical protein
VPVAELNEGNGRGGPDAAAARAVLAQLAQRLGSAGAVSALMAKVTVLSDAELAPETARREQRGLNHVSGYTKQQILKLAAAARVQTDWFHLRAMLLTISALAWLRFTYILRCRCE